MPYRIVANGDAGLSVVFTAQVSEKLTRHIQVLSRLCAKEFAGLVTDIIPAYQSLTLCYLPFAAHQQQIMEKLQRILRHDLPEQDLNSQLITIPVCYEQAYAPDLISLAQACDLSVEQVIALHSNTDYLLHMLGFSPGFLYLGGLDPRLSCPRKTTPSARVPAGSVGIGGNQTGIYPQQTPGGWHIIGRTPITLFNPNLPSPCVAQPLDKIRFTAISAADFEAIRHTPT